MTAQAKKNNPYLGPGPPSTLTRSKILDAAARLFYRQGLRAVSVDEVAEAASVTKVTVYKHFRSKDNLIASCLYMLDERFTTWFAAEVEAASGNPEGRLIAVFDVLGRWFQQRSFRGCAFINATVELADPSHPGHGAVVAHKERTRDFFRDLAVAAGVADPGTISDQWMLLSEGAIVTALVEDDRDAARRARKAAEALLAAAPRRRPGPQSSKTSTPTPS